MTLFLNIQQYICCYICLTARFHVGMLTKTARYVLSQNNSRTDFLQAYSRNTADRVVIHKTLTRMSGLSRPSNKSVLLFQYTARDSNFTSCKQTDTNTSNVWVLRQGLFKAKFNLGSFKGQHHKLGTFSGLYKPLVSRKEN